MRETYNLKPLWSFLLEMYKEIQKICKVYGLRHWGTGGTILGAIRHHGFIPWDDDFDLMMPRPDYKRFVEVANQMLPSKFRWRSVEIDDDYDLTFGKIYLIDEMMVDDLRRATNLDLAKGVFVDIFPIDGQPNTSLGLIVYKGIRALLRRLPLNTPKGRRFYQKYLSLLPYDRQKYIGVANEDSYKKHRCWWPKKWFDETVELPFESITVPFPKEYMSFIENHYRNWRELPPESARHPAHQTLEYRKYL